MNTASGVLLVASVILSSCRNLLSKSVSDFSFGSKSFFKIQTALFFIGGLTLLLFGKPTFSPSVFTLLYALVYGILLLSAQWAYTAALKKGNTGICATVYSLGFIFPTLSGVLLWNEKLSALNFLGVLTVIAAVIIAGAKSVEKQKASSENNGIVPLAVAMLSSGGLGIMQKIQQNSPHSEQKADFILAAFAIAAAISFIFGIFAKKTEGKICLKKLVGAGGVGICFGSCNLINTHLAGVLDSALFFPLLNISAILLSVISGILIFKEKPKIKDFFVLALGFLSIIILNA